MHLYFFLVVIVSLSCGSLPPADIPIYRAAAATLAMTSAWILLSHVAARVCAIQVRREKLDPIVAADLVEKQLGAFRWLGLGVVVLCLAGFGLARSFDGIPWLEKSMFLQSIILLAPGLAITVGTWSAEHYYGVMLDYTEKGLRNHFVSVWQMFRGGVAWLIAPVMLLLGMSDIIGLASTHRSRRCVHDGRHDRLVCSARLALVDPSPVQDNVSGAIGRGLGA